MSSAERITEVPRRDFRNVDTSSIDERLGNITPFVDFLSALAAISTVQGVVVDRYKDGGITVTRVFDELKRGDTAISDAFGVQAVFEASMNEILGVRVTGRIVECGDNFEGYVAEHIAHQKENSGAKTVAAFKFTDRASA